MRAVAETATTVHSCYVACSCLDMRCPWSYFGHETRRLCADTESRGSQFTGTRRVYRRSSFGQASCRHSPSKGKKLRRTAIDYLHHWVALQPDRLFAAFLNAQGDVTDSVTYSMLEVRSRTIGWHLVQQGVCPGDRVLLSYGSGLEVVAALVGCARVGAIGVPVPSFRTFGGMTPSRLEGIRANCGADVALGDYAPTDIAGSTDGRRVKDACSSIHGLRWVISPNIASDAGSPFIDRPCPTLFLQYTSGSTAAPRGVVVSHQNLIANCQAFLDHQPIGVSWLPQFHDMGLVGGYLYLIISGGTTYGFSPTDFLRRPLLWLEAISRYGATISSAPNFGFEYCLSEARVPAAHLHDLSLASLRILMNASEPAQPRTQRQFLDKFSCVGLRTESLVAGYGLAENTLAVTRGGRRGTKFDRGLLHSGRACHSAEDAPPSTERELLSCGPPLRGVDVRVVDPVTCRQVPDNVVGEVWVAGQSCAGAYWGQPELSETTFKNFLKEGSSATGPYLRTGDLGFIDGGELFICGRLKAVVILNGKNYFAEDLEWEVTASSPNIRPGFAVVFDTDDAYSGLVVVVGVRSPTSLPDAANITRALQECGYCGPHTIELVPHTEIARTTSGKVARALVRQKWLDGTLKSLIRYRRGDRPHLSVGSGVQSVFGRYLDSYDLKGDESFTLAEAGFDSLAIVTLLTELEPLLQSTLQGPSDNVLDAALLQGLEIREVTRLLHMIQNRSSGDLEQFFADLLTMKQEQQAAERLSMLRDLETRPLVNRGTDRDLGQNHVRRSILLTGGTGFFGPFLLRSLLEQSDATYTVLVRAPTAADGRNRLRTLLGSFGLYSGEVAERFESRVRVICGDLARPRLGLDEPVWASLVEELDGVVHSGARVNYVQNYDALRQVNVRGTQEALLLANSLRRPQFDLISSTMIFGWSKKGLLLETDANSSMADLDFGYAQTKWVAEHAALRARDLGVDVRIFRPAFLTVSTSGIGSRNDIVLRLLAFMINRGLAPAAYNQLSLMPVDIAASNIAAIMSSPPNGYPVYHVTVNRYSNLMDVLDVISARLGVRFRYVSLAEFSSKLCLLCRDDEPAYPLLDFVKQAHTKVDAMRHKRYSNRGYRQALAASGKITPHPPLEDTVTLMLDYMLREGLVERRTRGSAATSAVAADSVSLGATSDLPT